MRSWILISVAILMTGCASVGKKMPWYDPEVYDSAPAVVIRVIDADTIVVTIKDYPPVFGAAIPVRLYGMDAPEPNEPNGLDAKKYMESLVAPGDDVWLNGMKRDRFFRIIADVRLENAKGLSLGRLMVDGGYAELN